MPKAILWTLVLLGKPKQISNVWKSFWNVGFMERNGFSISLEICLLWWAKNVQRRKKKKQTYRTSKMAIMLTRVSHSMHWNSCGSVQFRPFAMLCAVCFKNGKKKSPSKCTRESRGNGKWMRVHFSLKWNGLLNRTHTQRESERRMAKTWINFCFYIENIQVN